MKSHVRRTGLDCGACCYSAGNAADLPFSGIADAQLRPDVREYMAVHRCLRALATAVVAVTVVVGDTSGPSAPRAGSQTRSFTPLASPMLDSLALASSSRSQVLPGPTSAAAHLAWDGPSVDVRWRPPLAVAIVTHLVTQSFVCPRESFAQAAGRAYRASLVKVTIFFTRSGCAV